MIVWGGYHAGWLQDGARFDPATSQWRPIPDDGPTARAALGAVWTGTGMLVWGGEDQRAAHADGGILR